LKNFKKYLASKQYYFANRHIKDNTKLQPSYPKPKGYLKLPLCLS